jgi:Lytic transglycolase
MKAKTKRRVLHVLTKKKLVKRKTSKHVLRSFLILLATISTGSLAYGITFNKPVVGVSVHTSAAGGIELKAPPTPTPTPIPVIKRGANGPVASGPAANTGRGSWYALGLPAPDSLTCASRTYPRGSYIHVTNLYNGKTVVCRVNDYGPEAWTNRIIDLSRGSFSAVENLGRGTIPVELRTASGPSGFTAPTEGDILAVVGYSLCATKHDAAYCEAHRQD